MTRLFLGIVFLLALYPFQVNAHRSGCHRWHSCPSDSGSYICGDTGHCNYCPDNQYCEANTPRSSSQVFENNNKESTVSFHCSDNKRYCGEMRSCAEARFFYSKCGVSRLDGDSDGIPCEKICR